MRGQKRAFLVDFDNTLIDADAIKAYWKASFPKFTQAYEETKKDSGYFEISKVAKLLSVDKTVFLDHDYKEYLFPKTLPLLRELKNLGLVVVYSLGDPSYQMAKIRTSGVQKVVGKDNITIVKDKILGLKKIITDLKKLGIQRISVIDDISDVLVETYKIDPEIQNIWVRFGTYRSILPTIPMAIDLETDSFPDAVKYINNNIETLISPKLEKKLSINNGIDKKQIDTLLDFARKDESVLKYTNDSRRFKDLKTFNDWQKHTKNIYTMTDSTGSLVGFSWFSKKILPDNPKFTYSFAIRVYPPARGKGLSKKFASAALKDFFKTHKDGVWLNTRKDNYAAIKLYKGIGLKNAGESDDRIQMILEVKNFLK